MFLRVFVKEFLLNLRLPRASLVAQKRIHLPMQETQEARVHSLHREDPLEEEVAAHSTLLAWRIPWMGESGGLQSTGSQRVRCN